MSLPICDNHPDGMWCPKCRWPGRDNPKPTDPDDITPEEIAAIEARCDAATPGPWMVADGCGYYVEDRHGNAVAKGFGPLNRPNADVIACAVTQLPRLLAALRRRDARIAELSVSHDKFYRAYDAANAKFVRAVTELRDIKDNWDCDADAHRYGTNCRACSAEKLLAEIEAEHGK